MWILQWDSVEEEKTLKASGRGTLILNTGAAASAGGSFVEKKCRRRRFLISGYCCIDSLVPACLTKASGLEIPTRGKHQNFHRHRLSCKVDSQIVVKYSLRRRELLQRKPAAAGGHVFTQFTRGWL